MRKACGDEKTAKWLEENLAIMPDVIRNAQKAAISPVSYTHLKMDKDDRLSAGWTMEQYEHQYRQAFAEAAKAADPTWKAGKPIPAGALDGITRESAESGRKSVDIKL